jgi:DNA recombination protein RmuC
VALALAGGAGLTWLILRRRAVRAFAAGQEAMGPDLERLSQALARQEAALRAAEAVRGRIETQLALAEQQNQALPELKNAIGVRDRQVQALNAALRDAAAALAAEKARSDQIPLLAARIEAHERNLASLQAALSARDARIAELQTLLDQERRRAEEQATLWRQARQDLTDQFRLLAQEILDEKGRLFGEQSRTDLKHLLDPFRDQLNEFRRKVDDVYAREAAERATLKAEIETLRDLNRQMGREAVNLTRALKGDKQAQGTWGELVLERVLEKSGLRRGIEYETQEVFRDPDGRLLRPDVVVHLPEGRCVVVDSKVSLTAYERYVNSEAEAERRSALKAHVGAVRAHIEALSAKNYPHLQGMRSLDYILMFLPIDAAFVAAFRDDEALYTHAFERHIVVVTPSTLLATLKTIDIIWRYERQNRSARDIFARAGFIYDKLRLVLESIERLGLQIQTLQGTYEETMNRLVRGKGNVMIQLARFSDLGVTVKKPVPQTLMDIAEIEAPDAECGGDGNAGNAS